MHLPPRVNCIKHGCYFYGWFNAYESVGNSVNRIELRGVSNEPTLFAVYNIIL